MHRVLLRDFPVQLAYEARQHGESLLRELAFIVADGRDDTPVARRLLELAAHTDEHYAGMNPEADALLDAAHARGDEYVDLDLQVPADFLDTALEAVPVLVEVDKFCRTGQLLTLPPSDELRAFWRWYLGEYIRQIGGEPPVSWRTVQA